MPSLDRTEPVVISLIRDLFPSSRSPVAVASLEISVHCRNPPGLRRARAVFRTGVGLLFEMAAMRRRMLTMSKVPTSSLGTLWGSLTASRMWRETPITTEHHRVNKVYVLELDCK